MVGRSVLLRVAKTPAQPKLEPALRSPMPTVLGDRGAVAVDRLSLAIRPGEIVGLAGVQGNGQDELIESIAGLRRSEAGRDHDLWRRARAGRTSRRAPGGPRLCAGRPRARWPVPAKRDLGEHGGRTSPSLSARSLPCRGSGAAAMPRADPAVRRARRQRRDAGGVAVGRQPAEGPARARVDPTRQAHHRRATLARRRHRRDRGDPSHARGHAGRRPRRLRCLRRPRRAFVPQRPHTRHVSRPHRRRVPGARSGCRGASGNCMGGSRKRSVRRPPHERARSTGPAQPSSPSRVMRA